MEIAIAIFCILAYGSMIAYFRCEDKYLPKEGPLYNEPYRLPDWWNGNKGYGWNKQYGQEKNKTRFRV